jgi:tRNA dimethylallyltransferase
MKNPLIVICGPTASGKTDLAIRIAKKFSGEIICSDSRTLYKELDILTAKPTKEEQKKVSHFLIDIIDPTEKFNVCEFQKLAQHQIKQIQKRNRIPFLVGGTGLYIDSVIKNYQIPRRSNDPKIRSKLEKMNLEELAQQLKKLDIKSYRNIDIHNKRRLVRALETFLSCGKSFIDLQKTKPADFQVLQIGILVPREILKFRIQKRIDQMFDSGLILEARKLKSKYPSNLPALSAIGYNYLFDYLDGKISLEGAKEKLLINTCQYAKRQMTWFRRDKSIYWVHNAQEVEKLIKNFLN